MLQATVTSIIKEAVQIFPVAVKVFQTSKSKEDFTREVKNLDSLKASTTTKEGVMKYIAAIVHGNKFMIIMPLANHYNLEIFFWSGKQLLEDSGEYKVKYDFDDRFSSIKTDADLHKALVKQVYQLADALVWLHEELGDFEKQNSYLAHMDLKPENILIYGNPQNEKTPVGQWTITDFGISAFYKDTHKPTQEVPTIRHMTSQFTSLSDVVRGRGPYQPPEIGLERKKEELGSDPRVRRPLDYRRCDVWSFGCVLSDVLAFALNRSQGIREIREARIQDGNDNLYKFVEGVEAIDNISASNTKLKEKFLEWGNQIRGSIAKPWVQGYLDILFEKSIVPCPTDRKSIGIIKTSLWELSPKLTSAIDANNLTKQGELELTQRKSPQGLPGPSISIQKSQEEHGQDSQEQLTEQNPHKEGRLSAGNLQGPFSLNAMSAARRRAPTKKPQDSPSESSSSSMIRRKHQNPGNGVIEGSPSVSAQSQKNPADDQQLWIVDADLTPSIIPVSLDKKASVKAVALESTGERIAILCETKVYIFPTREPEPSGQKSLDISAEVKWANVRIAHPWLAIFGAKESNEIVVSYTTFAASSNTIMRPSSGFGI